MVGPFMERSLCVEVGGQVWIFETRVSNGHLFERSYLEAGLQLFLFCLVGIM